MVVDSSINQELKGYDTNLNHNLNLITEAKLWQKYHELLRLKARLVADAKNKGVQLPPLVRKFGVGIGTKYRPRHNDDRIDVGLHCNQHSIPKT